MSTTPETYRNWWLIALKGLLYAAMGALAIYNPFETLVILFSFLGIFLAVTGGVLVLFAITNKGAMSFFQLAFRGGIDILLGIAMMAYPGQILAMINLFFGVLIVAAGVFTITQALRLRSTIQLWRPLLVVGIVLLIPGIIIFFYPLENAMVITILVGISLLLYGLSMVVKGFQIRSS